MATFMRTYYVYVMTNRINTVLYTGMTGRGEQRIGEHVEKVIPSFTARYNLSKVVYVEGFSSAQEAAEAERKIKGWRRKRKIDLIESVNPKWEDLLRGDASLRSAIRGSYP